VLERGTEVIEVIRNGNASRKQRLFAALVLPRV
jgi:hypothetical protein